MTALAWLIPISLALGLTGLVAFLWSLRAGQYRDIEGDAARILLPDDPEPNLAGKPCRKACAACKCATGPELGT